MKASEIRSRFLEYFESNGHTVVPSAPLIPKDDPTLLFTNAGMVPFKRIFLGQEVVDFSRAASSQKCVRAGGKHNDLEEVGQTARHHTFFEMLGNFSFGEYFKADAIRFAWEFLVTELGIDPAWLYVSVHDSDDEAADLWVRTTGVPASRVYRLGDADNFWQMADTGPCGPSSEVHVDLRPGSERGSELDHAQFVALTEAGAILEIWNLVFMQFDRDEEGTLHPLPAPSIDTGLGMERTAAVLQGVDSNYHTDLFLPLLDRIGEIVGQPYEAESERGLSYRVLADHARAVSFLLADGVFPSNEGRGYVLRRILRRAVRHAWLLGRREPTLVGVVEQVVEEMGEAYPELPARREHLVGTTRAEEERFLTTIEGGMSRFEAVTPSGADSGVISGADAFKLYDTFGFPLDLTELMARERGYDVDVEGFEIALAEQRDRSRADRANSRIQVDAVDEDGWIPLGSGEQRWVGYDRTEVDAPVLAYWTDADSGRVGLQLAENPFYAQGGGQISDSGSIRIGDVEWEIDEVVRVGTRVSVFGSPDPSVGFSPETIAVDDTVHARVNEALRHDTARNHTATHLLHAALRETLGTHVVQRGSLVAPDRLRFDFSHSGPLTVDERERIEARVNEGVWYDHPVRTEEMAYDRAVEEGAMALFGEKYGDSVRVVRIPGVSMELCGGTHVRHTGEIGLFRITSEGGVASGVRRVEAVTGPGAFRYLRERERLLEGVSDQLKTSPEHLLKRVGALLDEKTENERLIDELRKEGGGGETVIAEESIPVSNGSHATVRVVRLKVRDAADARDWGDRFLESESRAVGIAGVEAPGDKWMLFTFVTDDLIQDGVRADHIVRDVAAIAGGRGGGRPHLAQAGISDPSLLDEALRSSPGIVRALVGAREGE